MDTVPFLNPKTWTQDMNPTCKLIQLTIRDSYLGLEILHPNYLGLVQGAVPVIKSASGEDTKFPGP